MIGPHHSNFEHRIYSLQVARRPRPGSGDSARARASTPPSPPPAQICCPRYPHVPPTVRSLTQIAIPCIASNGALDVKKLIPNWKYSNKIEDLLHALRNEMSKPGNKARPQPAEGAMY